MYNLPKEPKFKMPNIPRVKLTLEEIKQLSDDELMMLLSGEGQNGIIPAPLLQAISYELTSRQIKNSSKPHWAVYVSLVFTVIAALASVLALLK